MLSGALFLLKQKHASKTRQNQPLYLVDFEWLPCSNSSASSVAEQGSHSKLKCDVKLLTALILGFVQAGLNCCFCFCMQKHPSQLQQAKPALVRESNN
jgi:hypothetical protein